MLRVVFRVLVAATLLVMYVSRSGHMNPYAFLPFYYWFLLTIIVFGSFGIYSIKKAVKDPQNRRAYLLDILIAVSWVPYWMAMLH